MRAPDLDDNELDDEASRKFHEALASGKAKVRFKTMPTTTSDLAARISDAKEQLKTFIRIHNPGGCRMFSRGHECNCPLCLVDDLVADWERLRQRVAELEGEKDSEWT